MSLKLALLVCDTPPPAVTEVYGAYPEIFHTLLSDSFPSTSWSTLHLDGLDGIIITGSKASAYENLEWINRLVDWVATVIREKSAIKIVGICYGHQIIARSLGGQCVPNDGKWEIGPIKIALNVVGQKVFGGRDSLTIHQMHRDHVPLSSLPAGSVHLLGTTPVCENQGFVTFYPGTEKIHIFTVQGHPEFVNDLVKKLVQLRKSSGVIDVPTAEEFETRKDDEHHGVSVIGKVIWKVLGVE
ncbi:class I glutamine amidotransferase-like protein, partial [Flagelloscypha sp. PMI_526]